MDFLDIICSNATTSHNYFNAIIVVRENTRHLFAINVDSEEEVEQRFNPEVLPTLNVEHRIRSNFGVFLRIDSPNLFGVEFQIRSIFTILKCQSLPHRFSQYTPFRTFPPYSIPSKIMTHLLVWKFTQVHAILFSILTVGTV